MSQRLFQRRLPLKDNDSIPNFVVRVFGNRHKFFVRKSYFTTFLSWNSQIYEGFKLFIVLKNLNPSYIWEFHERKVVKYDLRTKNLCAPV